MLSRSHTSDAALARFDGEVIDRGEYILVRTRSNPTFFWGNFLIYPRPPVTADLGPWLAADAREFEDRKDRAAIFAWDQIDGASGEDAGFLQRGFVRDVGVCMSAKRLLRAPKHNEDVVVRPLEDDAAWSAATACLTNAFTTRGKNEVQREFVVRQMTRYRAMQAAGWGTWYGAFVGNVCAASCGLVRQGSVGRFQLVGTDPAFARRGICSTMMYDVGSRGLAVLEEVIIVADETYHATKVYQAVGFSVVERLATLMRVPK